MDEAITRLPDVKTVGLLAPFGWLAGGWADFRKSMGPCLVYGAILVAVSVGLTMAFYQAGIIRWLFVAVAGFMLVAPILAMGLYQTGRMLEQGQKPGLGDILFVRSALRLDLFILGFALFVVFSMWAEMAHLVYGLSTYKMHRTLGAFVNFMLYDPEGHNMVMMGTLVGGVIAFVAYALIVVSAPMMLNTNANVFVATITSLRTVARNFLPMLVWAVLIVVLTMLGIAAGFIGLVITFPVIGLASWRAYRDLVPSSAQDLVPEKA